MVSANEDPSKRAAVGMTSHLCGRNVSSMRMALATNGRWTYWDRATIELKSNKDRELPNEPNRPVKGLRAGREISRLGSSLSEKTPRPIHPKPICFTIICNACLPPGCTLHLKPFAWGAPSKHSAQERSRTGGLHNGRAPRNRSPAFCLGT